MYMIGFYGMSGISAFDYVDLPGGKKRPANCVAFCEVADLNKVDKIVQKLQKSTGYRIVASVVTHINDKPQVPWIPEVFDIKNSPKFIRK